MISSYAKIISNKDFAWLRKNEYFPVMHVNPLSVFADRLNKMSTLQGSFV